MKNCLFKRAALLVACVGMAFSASATWTYDGTTLSDDDWTITLAEKKSSSGKDYLKITGTFSRNEDSSATTLDMTGAAAAANVNYIELWASIPSSLGVTKFFGPDVTYLREYMCFSGNTTIEEIELSPNTTCIGHYALRNATALRKLTPTTFPKLTTLGQQAFENDALLEGDFEFPEITSLSASTFCMTRKITSLKFDKLTTATANFTFCGMTSLTNFYAPKAVNVSTIAFYHSNYGSYPCSKLETVTLSGNATQIPQFKYCSSLKSITPTEFPKLTTEPSFVNCSKLVCALSFPNTKTLSQSAFEGSGVTSLYLPKLAKLPSCCFGSCKNLKSLTVDGSSGFAGSYCITRAADSFVLDWCSTNPPTGWGHGYPYEDGVKVHRHSVQTENPLCPAIFKVRLTADNRAALEAICTKTAANFTAAHRAISNYGQVAKKAIGFVGTPTLKNGVVTSISDVETKGIFWLVDGTPVASVDVTINCPAGVKVAKVTTGGFEVLVNDDGTYTIETEDEAKMDITYAPTEGKLFTDGTTAVTVANLTPVATIEASVCPKTTVDALARIGNALYLTLQDAVNVGGDVALMTNQTLAATVTIAADKAVSLDLSGKTLTAASTAFDVAGSLVIVGEGTLEASAPFAGAGSVQLQGGTYTVDVTAYCTPGYVATAQGTTPQTWVVAPNTNVTTLTLDTATFAADHIAAVSLVTTAPVLCETNGTVITWTIAKELPFSLAYTALGSYRFADRTRFASVAYAAGIAAETTASTADVPERIYHPTWSWDKANGTCTDGNWAFTCSKSTGLVSVGGVDGIAITAYQSGCGDLDLITFKDDVGAGVDVIAFQGWIFRYKPNTVTNVCAPAVRYISNRAFGSEGDSGRSLKTAEFSPDIETIDQYNFGSCQKLEKLVPISFPKLTTFNDTFSDCSKLTGDISMPKVKTLAGSAFKNTRITSLYAPKVSNMPANCFEGCMSLTNVTIAGGSGVVNGLYITRVCDNFVLDWCSTNVPTSFGHGYTYEGTNRVHRMAIQSENPLSPVILKALVTDENRAAWEAICTKTRANFTAAHKAISNYALVRQMVKKSKRIIGFVGYPNTNKDGVVTSIGAVEPKGIFWVVDGTVNTNGFTVIIR